MSSPIQPRKVPCRVSPRRRAWRLSSASAVPVPGDHEADVSEGLGQRRQRVEREMKTLFVHQPADQQNQQLDRAAANRAAQRIEVGSATGSRSRGSIPLGITVIRDGGHTEHPRDVAAHVPRAGDHAIGAADHRRARPRGCGTADGSGPSPGDDPTRSRARSSPTAGRSAGPRPRRRRRPASRASARASKSSRSRSSSASSPMSAFIDSTQRTNALGSFGNSGSRTRCTTTPCRSSSTGSRAPPRVSTCTSVPSCTRCSESLRTCRASPPSMTGGYSQEISRTRMPRR